MVMNLNLHTMMSHSVNINLTKSQAHQNLKITLNPTTERKKIQHLIMLQSAKLFIVKLKVTLVVWVNLNNSELWQDHRMQMIHNLVQQQKTGKKKSHFKIKSWLIIQSLAEGLEQTNRLEEWFRRPSKLHLILFKRTIKCQWRLAWS